MKRENTWQLPPKRVCSDTTSVKDDFSLNLFDNFNTEEIYGENLIGPFHLDPEKTVGKSHANFQMDIHRLVFKENTQEPESNQVLGTWTTGFTEKDLINTKGFDQQWTDHIALTVFRIVTVVVCT